MNYANGAAEQITSQHSNATYLMMLCAYIWPPSMQMSFIPNKAQQQH